MSEHPAPTEVSKSRMKCRSPAVWRRGGSGGELPKSLVCLCCLPCFSLVIFVVSNVFCVVFVFHPSIYLSFVFSVFSPKCQSFRVCCAISLVCVVSLACVLSPLCEFVVSRVVLLSLLCVSCFLPCVLSVTPCVLCGLPCVLPCAPGVLVGLSCVCFRFFRVFLVGVLHCVLCVL